MESKQPKLFHLKNTVIVAKDDETAKHLQRIVSRKNLKNFLNRISNGSPDNKTGRND